MLLSKVSSLRLLRISCNPSKNSPSLHFHFHTQRRNFAAARHPVSDGVNTSSAGDVSEVQPSREAPFYFETGYALFAKRPSRPFPPPFLSLPSGSFSDPLTTHTASRDRRPSVNGQYIKGVTNGDDAVIINGGNFLGVNDGVGAWAAKDRGHAALWSRLIAHFWAAEAEKAVAAAVADVSPDTDIVLRPAEYLQTAFDQTKLVTSKPNEISGTTTACSAILFHRLNPELTPIIYATNLGDCAALVIRPQSGEIIYKTTEQWHWFDCPRQLGTNSPDTPRANAVVDIVDIQVGDVVLVVSDGVSDNLWENEVCQNVCDSVRRWGEGAEGTEDGMVFVARELMNAARTIAMDSFAESPFMERATEEGLPMEGGKLDDISVVVGMCRARNTTQER